jgi:hypothetical protein
MSANRISSYLPGSEPSRAIVPAGFAVCQLPQAAQNPLALQLIAQQRAYEQAILNVREEALKIALARVQPSVN